MTRPWGPTGVGNARVVTISDSVKEQLRATLKSFKVDVSNFSSFIEETEQAVSKYYSMKKFAEKSSPAAVRENLKVTIATAKKLQKNIDNLDHNSMNLIGEVTEGGMSVLRQSMGQIINSLCSAKMKAQDYPQRGNRKSYERPALAVDIGRAIRDILGREPTVTKNGLFEECVSIIIEAVIGEPVNNIHTLIESAKKEL